MQRRRRVPPGERGLGVVLDEFPDAPDDTDEAPIVWMALATVARVGAGRFGVVGPIGHAGDRSLAASAAQLDISLTSSVQLGRSRPLPVADLELSSTRRLPQPSLSSAVAVAVAVDSHLHL